MGVCGDDYLVLDFRYLEGREKRICITASAEEGSRRRYAMMSYELCIMIEIHSSTGNSLAGSLLMDLC